MSNRLYITIVLTVAFVLIVLASQLSRLIFDMPASLVASAIAGVIIGMVASTLAHERLMSSRFRDRR